VTENKQPHASDHSKHVVSGVDHKDRCTADCWTVLLKSDWWQVWIFCLFVDGVLHPCRQRQMTATNGANTCPRMGDDANFRWTWALLPSHVDLAWSGRKDSMRTKSHRMCGNPRIACHEAVIAVFLQEWKDTGSRSQKSGQLKRAKRRCWFRLVWMHAI
jgi:hypothetical protein